MHAGLLYHEPLLADLEDQEYLATSIASDALHSNAHTPTAPKNGGSVVNAAANSINKQHSQYKVYTERWWVLFVFCLISFGQSVIWITYSPITDSAKAYYNISEAQVDLLLNWGTIFFVVFTPVCIYYAKDAEGLRRLIIACAWFEFAAVVLRMIPEWIEKETLKPYAVYFLHAAHISNAFACPPISITVCKLSCVWFRQHERSMITGVAVVMNNVGTAVGMILGPYVVSEPSQIPHLLYIHLVFGIFTLICTLAYFPAQPRTYPSYAAQHMLEHPPEAFLPSLRLVGTNRNAVFVALGAGCLTGIFNVWSGILETILSSAYSDSTIGWLSFTATIGGIIGGVTFGRLATHQKLRTKLKLLIVTLAAGALCASLWFTFSMGSFITKHTLLPTGIGSIGVSITLVGFFVGSSYPLAFELVAELTYPLSESVSGGMLAMVSNGLGAVFLFVAPSMSGVAMNACLVFIVMTGLMLVPFAHENYLRHEAEQNALREALHRAQHHALESSANGDKVYPTNGSTTVNGHS